MVQCGRYTCFHSQTARFEPFFLTCNVTLLCLITNEYMPTESRPDMFQPSFFFFISTAKLLNITLIFDEIEAVVTLTILKLTLYTDKKL